MAEACARSGVPLVSGDTKVVERGKADGVFISTTCLGGIPNGVEISPSRARPSDVILVSGPIGDHGIAILSQRPGLAFDCDVQSDSAALHTLVATMLAVTPEPYAKLGSLEFSKQLLEKAKLCVSPGIGFGDHGDDHVRFALIENENRIRQAVRGIKAMFKADGVGS